MVKILSYFLGIALLISCSTSNQVVSNKLFQKRKYKKGWHINSTQRVPNSSSRVDEDTKYLAQETTLSDSSSREIVNNPIVLQEAPKQTNSSDLIPRQALPIISKKQPNNSRANISSVVLSEKVTVLKPANASLGKQKLIPSQSSPPDESDRRVLFAILGILILVFTTISPLAVLVGIGRGNSLRINSAMYFTAVILAIVGIALLFSSGFSSGPAAIAITASLILWLISVIHALVVIIRGF